MTNLIDLMMVTLTKAGNNGFIWIAIIGLLLLAKPTRKIGFLSLVSLIVSVIAQDLLKDMIQRPRPPAGADMLIEMPSSYSFPSGHSLISFCVAATIFQLKTVIGLPALLLACFIAVSRVYLGVHYVSDVFFGALFGMIISMAIVLAWKKWEQRRQDKELEM